METCTAAWEVGDELQVLYCFAIVLSQQGYAISIEIDGDQVVARGQSSTITDVINCVTVLQDIGYFSEIRIDEIEVMRGMTALEQRSHSPLL